MTSITPLHRAGPEKRSSRRQSTPEAADRTLAIERFRRIARESRDHMILSDGPVHPDAELLDGCSEALHLILRAEKLHAEGRHPEAWKTGTAPARTILLRIRKLRASTAAGIYAKALLVRHSRTGAPELAKSLADDLIAIPSLRASLWPVEGGAQ